MPDGLVAVDHAAERALGRLPTEVINGLTAEQKAAIASALAGRAGGRTPVNLRLSIPLFGWRFFLAIMAGHDRRSIERRTVERQRHPVRTTGNFLFIVAGAMTFYLVALGCFLLWSSVVEF